MDHLGCVFFPSFLCYFQRNFSGNAVEMKFLLLFLALVLTQCKFNKISTPLWICVRNKRISLHPSPTLHTKSSYISHAACHLHWSNPQFNVFRPFLKRAKIYGFLTFMLCNFLVQKRQCISKDCPWASAIKSSIC